ncbi:MAG TPA: alpha/beta hydrolase [Acidimicrobiales bacterium]
MSAVDVSGRWCLPPLRPGTDADEELTARRAMVAALAGQRREDGVSVQRRSTGGVDGVVCRPDSGAAAVIVHFHGGGYRLGSAAGSTAFGTRLAAATGCSVVVPDYRLAPEHPFPAALHDAAAVYDALVANESDAVVVSGDSAGGGLAVAVVVAALEAGVRAPDGLVLFSPWADLGVTGPSFTSRAGTDQLFSRDAAHAAAAAYLQGVDPRHPLASPLGANLAGLPPTLVFAAIDEVLLDDAVALAAGLTHAGVAVEAHFVAGVQHVWPTVFPDLPESAAALAAVARFISTPK